MTADTSVSETTTGKIAYSTRIKFLNQIAKPLAEKSLTKKIYKLVKKGNPITLLLLFRKSTRKTYLSYDKYLKFPKIPNTWVLSNSYS